jgi:hypothetical protein
MKTVKRKSAKGKGPKWEKFYADVRETCETGRLTLDDARWTWALGLAHVWDLKERESDIALINKECPPSTQIRSE